MATIGQPGISSNTLTADAYEQYMTDSSSFSLTIDSGQRNAIQWIVAKDRILMGTTSGEWQMSGHGDRSDKPITPFSFNIKEQTKWGSKDMQPLVLHEAVLFVDYVGRKLRGMTYNGSQERYQSPDLLLLAEHITRSGRIVTMAYQRNPDSIVWLTLSNGELVSCTLDKEQDVVAWARHPTTIGTIIEEEEEEAIYVPPVSTDYPLLRTTTTHADPQLPHVLAINNFEDLAAMSNNLTGHYYLTCDIDASITADASYNSGYGFQSIGGWNNLNPFMGTFDGCGYTIAGLHITRNYVLGNWGLFGTIKSPAKIANVTLADVHFTTGGESGALVGIVEATTTAGILIQNCHSSGVINADDVTPLYYGGLIGSCNLIYGSATQIVEIYDCSSSCDVNALTVGSSVQDYAFGGFVGYVGHSIVQNCFATGNVTGPDSGTHNGGFAGIIGKNSVTDTTTKVSYCYATGNVTGEDGVGGFVGTAQFAAGGYIRRCYSTGTVTSDGPASNTNHGGFVGTCGAIVTDCYARGNVTMSDGTRGGGFVGTGGTITNCYSIGSVISGGTLYGGFGGGGSTEISCYWDTETSGHGTSGGDEIGYETTLMKTQSTYVDWDFDDIWYMEGAIPYIDEENTLSLGFNSVTVIPSTTEDEVWISVGRAINGTLVRYIERMKPRVWGTSQHDCFFVDSGLSYDSTATTTFTGLGHLEGETVAILGDGAVFPTQTVTNGTVTLPEAVSVCHIGLPFTYKLKPMRMDQNYGGTTKGVVHRIVAVIVSFYKSLNAMCGDGTDTRNFDWRSDEPYTTPPELYTGDKSGSFVGGYDAEKPIEISGSDPLPCTVRCIIPKIEMTGR